MEYFLYILLNVAFGVISLSIYLLMGERLADKSIIVSLVVAMVFSVFFTYSLGASIVFISTISIDTLYRKRSLISVAILIAVLFMNLTFNFSENTVLVESLSVGVGMAISLILSNYMRMEIFKNESEKGHENKIETTRDVFQIAVGILIILAIVMFPKFLILLGLISGSIIAIIILDLVGLFRNTKMSKLVFRLERKNVQPGLGTLWFIAGLMLLVSLSPKWRVVEVGVFAMGVGDSLATIFGMNFRISGLFYNRKKSVGGFIFMLIPTAIFAMMILGPSYFIVALVATFVESISRYPLDDNVTIPSSIILSNLLLSIL